MEYDSDDRHAAALCACKEARGDGDGAMRAILHLIANRVGHPGFAPTLHEVVFQKNQFLSMSVPSDPQFNWTPKFPADVKAFDYCMSIADAVLQASMEDITKGAHFYANIKNVAGGWFKANIIDKPAEHPVTVQIAHHTFYV